MSSSSFRWCSVPNSSAVRPPCQSSVYKSPPYCCGSSKCTFTFAEYLFSSMFSITPVTIMPVKMHSQCLPIRSLLTSVVFMSSKFYRLLLRSFFSTHLLRLRRHSASVLATVENSSPSVWR